MHQETTYKVPSPRALHQTKPKRGIRKAYNGTIEMGHKCVNTKGKNKG